MSSKLFILFCFFILASCGVKSAPEVPKGQVLPSILAPYLNDQNQQNKELEINDGDFSNAKDDPF